MTYPRLILRFDWENHCQNLTKLKAVEKKGGTGGGGKIPGASTPQGGRNVGKMLTCFASLYVCLKKNSSMAIGATVKRVGGP